MLGSRNMCDTQSMSGIKRTEGHCALQTLAVQEVPGDLLNCVGEGSHHGVAKKVGRRRSALVMQLEHVASLQTWSAGAMARARLSVGDNELHMISCYLPHGGMGEGKWLGLFL